MLVILRGSLAGIVEGKNKHKVVWFQEGCKCVWCDASKAAFRPDVAECGGQSSSCSVHATASEPRCFGKELFMPYHTGMCNCATGLFMNEETLRLGGSATFEDMAPGEFVVLESISPQLKESGGSKDIEKKGGHGGATLTTSTMEVKVSSNGHFFFPYKLAYGQNFKLKIGEHAEGTKCTVDMGGMSMDGIEWWGPAYVDILDLNLNCKGDGKQHHAPDLNEEDNDDANRDEEDNDDTNKEDEERGQDESHSKSHTKTLEDDGHHRRKEHARAQEAKKEKAEEKVAAKKALADDGKCKCLMCQDNKPKALPVLRAGKKRYSTDYCLGFSLACNAGDGEGTPEAEAGGCYGARAGVSGSCSCGSGDFKDPELYKVGGVIEGLEDGQLVVIRLRTPLPSESPFAPKTGSDTVQKNSSGSSIEDPAHPSHQLYAEQREIRSLGGRFFFPVKLSLGQRYLVEVADHPRDQRCTVDASTATGVVAVAKGGQYDEGRAELRRAQVVKIRCLYKGRWKFVLGGQVTGLTADTTLVLTSATTVTRGAAGAAGHTRGKVGAGAVAAAGAAVNVHKNVSVSRLVITSDGHFTFPEQEVAASQYAALPAGVAPSTWAEEGLARGTADGNENIAPAALEEQLQYDVAIAKAPSNQDCKVIFGDGTALQDGNSEETRLTKVQVSCKSKLAKNRAEGGEGGAGTAALDKNNAEDGEPDGEKAPKDLDDQHLEWFSEGCECMRCDGSKAHFQPHSVCHGQSSGCVQDDPFEGCYGQQTIRPYHTGTCECSTETFLKPELHRIGGVLKGLEPGQSLMLSSSSPKMIDNEKVNDDSLAVQHTDLHTDGTLYLACVVRRFASVA
jgi:hypothetical protein